MKFATRHFGYIRFITAVCKLILKKTFKKHLALWVYYVFKFTVHRSHWYMKNRCALMDGCQKLTIRLILDESISVYVCIPDCKWAAGIACIVVLHAFRLLISLLFAIFGSYRMCSFPNNAVNNVFTLFTQCKSLRVETYSGAKSSKV